jgi:putative phage-type endonuclease
MALIFNYHKDLPKVTDLKQKYLQEQVILLKKIFQPEQKSKEWYEMRNNMLTASDWGTILGENHYSNSNEVLKKKCGDDTFFTNSAMQWGNKYESVAVLIYEHRNNVSVLEFGCLRHPFIPFLGASPDGITSDGIMLEIKCPPSRKITGIPPSHYWCQVQGQLEVCELDRCDFLECNLKEYTDEEEYLQDNYEGNFFLNKYMNEKGAIAEFYCKGSKTFIYEYSPVCLIGNDLETWKNDMIRKYQYIKNSKDDVIFSTFSYWYLEEVSCVPIYRNQEWFNKAKVELEIFWNKVLKYRELGLEKLIFDINEEKEEKKKMKLEIKEENLQKKTSAKKDKVPKVSVVKKQKKIKEFIVLDDFKEDINKNSDENITMSSSDDDYFDDFITNNKTSMFTNTDDEVEHTIDSTKFKKSTIKLSMFSD